MLQLRLLLWRQVRYLVRQWDQRFAGSSVAWDARDGESAKAFRAVRLQNRFGQVFAGSEVRVVQCDHFRAKSGTGTREEAGVGLEMCYGAGEHGD